MICRHLIRLRWPLDHIRREDPETAAFVAVVRDRAAVAGMITATAATVAMNPTVAPVEPSVTMIVTEAKLQTEKASRDLSMHAPLVWTELGPA